MDALRPTAANVARVNNPAAGALKERRRSDVGEGRREDKAPNHAATTVRPSPNSFAPLHPNGVSSSSATAASPSKSAAHAAPVRVPQVVPGQQRAQHAASAPYDATALPAFLSRRPTNQGGHQPTSSVAVRVLPPTLTSSTTLDNHSGDDSDDDAHPAVSGDNAGAHIPGDEGDLVDEALFEECLDLDEDEQTEDDLKAIAEDLSATTGLSHAEVLELLLEQQREKQAKRKSMLKARQEGEVLQALIRKPHSNTSNEHRPQRQQSNETNLGAILFVTATPDLVRGEQPSAFAPQAPPPKQPVPPKIVPSSLPPLARDDDDNDGGGGAQVESSARRMKRQLAELFPQMSSTTTSPSAAASGKGSVAGGGVGDTFVDLQTYRAQRAAKQHAAVAGHLASLRVNMELPKSLETRDVFVKAYELEMRKRRTAKEEKDEALRKQKEEEDKERRMKGFFSNEAIRKKIDEHTAALTAKGSTKESVGTAAPQSRLRSHSKSAR